MSASASLQLPETHDPSATRQRDHAHDGKFRPGNRAAKKRKSKPNVAIPPPPAPVEEAGLGAVWTAVYAKAINGNVAAARLILELRKADSEDLTGKFSWDDGDDLDDAD